MTRTEFGSLAFFWGWWTFFEAVWIAVLWQSRSRVLGGAVYRMPGVRRIGRRACESRVEALLAELERRGVPAEGRPDRGQLVDRWHRIAAGRCVSVPLQVVPLLVAVLPFAWTTSIAPATPTPLWMCAAVAGFALVSMTLMAADERVSVVSDAAGTVTVEAVRFLETLLIQDGRRTQDSALDVHARVFGRLCHALRAQARHTARRMPPAARERMRDITERLTAALADANQRYLFGEGPDRDTAARDLSRLAAGALRHSCRPRTQRDSLVIVDAALLADAPEPDSAGVAAEPLGSRLRAGAGRLVLAAGLLAGAVLLPGGGAASELLAAAGLASLALVCPPLREALHRVRDLLVGGSFTENTAVPETATGTPSHPASASTMPCPHCSDSSPVPGPSRAAEPRPLLRS